MAQTSRRKKRSNSPTKHQVAINSDSNAAQDEQTAASFRVRGWDYVFASVFLVLWLLPMGYRGMTNDVLWTWLPNEVTFQHNISRLFTTSVQAWPTYHLQGTFDGRVWFTLPDEQYSPMQPFGRRARIDRMIADNAPERGQTRVGPLRAELLTWLRHRFQVVHPESPPLRGARVVRLAFKIGDRLAEPQGHWRKLIPEHVPNQRPRVLFSLLFEDTET